MPTVKRRIANLIEHVSGNLVIAPGEVSRGPERLHLRRFFQHFAIDCVFDVGANVGQYATMLRDFVGFRGPIISYEPDPEIAERLRHEAAGDPRWHIETLALDREPGPAMFNIMAASEFSSLHPPAADQPEIFDAPNRIVRQLRVDRATLAGELPRWQKKLGFARPFLKMDTQGNDLAVLEGAGESLSAFIGVQSELAIRKLYRDSPGYTEVIAWLESRGYVLSALVPNTAGHFPILVEIDCIMVRQTAVSETPR